MTEPVVRDKASIGASKSLKPRVNKYSLGTQYQQRTEDGINTQLFEYSLEFKNIPEKIDALDTFLTEMGGTTAFRWRYKDQPSKVFLCEEWEVWFTDKGYKTLTATFQEQPEYVEYPFRTLDGTWVIDGIPTLNYDINYDF